MNLLKKAFLSVLIFTTSIIFSQSQIIGTIDGSEYSVGETIVLSVNLKNINNFHGLFFNIDYNSECFKFQGIDKGDIVYNNNSQLLYSKSSNDSSIIFSYTLLDRIASINSVNDKLVDIRFKVIKKNSVFNNFLFTNKGVKNTSGQLIDNITWNNSNSISIVTNNSLGYIAIKNPYENQVFTKGSIDVDVISTLGAGFYGILTNIENGYVSEKINCETGFFTKEDIPISNGFNNIKLRLYNSENLIIAEDKVKVFKSDATDYINIVTPNNKSIVNSNVIEVEVESTMANIEVNGVIPELEQGITTNSKVKKYKTNVWLKSGNNKIKVQGINAQGAIFNKEIDVFYQVNDSVFSIKYPGNGDIIKSSNKNFKVLGEINSKYESIELSTGTSMNENEVLLNIFYYPDSNPLEKKVIAQDKKAIIRTTGINENLRTQYAFEYNIDLTEFNLSQGKLITQAYKNRGSSSEEFFETISKIDSSNLKLQLIRPNIYNEDKITTIPQESLSNIKINSDGSYQVTQKDNSNNLTNTLLDDYNYIYIDSNDTVWSLINKSGYMTLKKRDKGEVGFSNVIKVPNMYGYTVIESSKGLLLGVSNLYSNNKSGLYLLNKQNDNYTLQNIQIGKPIPHVQNIIIHDDQVFLYGDNYSNIYSFNINNLYEFDNNLISYYSSEIPFNVELSISDLQITSDLKLAVVKTLNGLVKIYQNRNGYGFKEVYIEDYSFKPKDIYSEVVLGEYKFGGYNAILLLGNENRVVMENRATGELFSNTLITSNKEPIIGAAFVDDNFKLLQYFNNTFYIDSGKLQFSNFTSELLKRDVYISNTTIEPFIESKLKITKSTAYLNLKHGNSKRLLTFSNLLNELGSINYVYNNPSIDVSTGVSFNISNEWLESNIKIGIGNDNIESNKYFLDNLLNNKLISEVNLTSTNNSNLTNVDIKFNKPINTLQLSIDLLTSNNSTPILSSLTIYNKSPLKLIKSENTLSLPIMGLVNDPTVKKVYIGQHSVDVVNGEFSTTESLIPIGSSNLIPITISANNSIGESDEIAFNVELVDSYNGITKLSYTNSNNVIEPFNLETNPILSINTEDLTINGEYYGLKGLTIGYEVYKGTNSDLESNILMESGFIARSINSNSNLTNYIGVTEDNKHFYESGSFSHVIKTRPGNQVLVVFIDNPGGKRTKYYFKNNNIITYPEINYDLPESEQEIILNNIGIEQGTTTNYTLVVNANESESVPYVYKKEVEITGRIKSPYSVDKILLKLESDIATFLDGTKETTVNVNLDNTFTIPVNTELPEDSESGKFTLFIEPNAPFLSYIKTDLEVLIEKDFEQTEINPDFSLMDFSKWSDSDVKKMSKPLRIAFSRYIPEGAELSLLVNFNTYITGKLEVVDKLLGIYKIIDKNGNQQSLFGIKEGPNIIHWSITHKGYVISSSNSIGMSEYFLDYTLNNITYKDTILEFSSDIDSKIFKLSELPTLSIKKDKDTYVGVKINNNLFWFDEGSIEDYVINLNNLDLVEGVNKLTTIIKNKKENEIVEEFSFTYDSVEPQISLEFENYLELDVVSLSFLVTEANLNSVIIKKNGNKIDAPNIIPVSSNIFRISINNITFNQLDEIDIECTDIVSNTKTYKHVLKGLNLSLTEEDNRNIQLPIYYNNSEFQFDNERTDYTTFTVNEYSRIFPSIISLLDKTNSNREMFKINNVEDIKLSEFTNGKTNLELSGNSIEILPGFESIGNIEITAISKDNSSQKWGFYHDKESEAIVFTFWFRDDSQDYFENNKVYRVLQLDSENSINSDGENLFLNNSSSKLPIDKNIWNYIAIKVQDGNIDIVKRENLTSSINDGVYVGISNTNIDISNIIKDKAIYYFGNTDRTLNGYFSLAYPYYVNNSLKNNITDPGTYSSIESIYGYITLTSSSDTVSDILDRTYNFNTINEEGTDNRQYKPLVINSNVRTSYENVNYEEENGSSLLASKIISNLLKNTNNGIQYNNNDSQTQLINLVQTENNNEYILTPLNIFIPGLYYFDSVDSESNRGMAIVDNGDNNYTISGSIAPLKDSEDLNANFVIKVDFKEYKYNLNTGDFKLSFNSENLNIKPDSNVHIYIETRTEVILSKDIRLTKGAYRSPIVSQKSAVTFNEMFNNQGSISFWYKPFNIEDNGFTSYESVLFDSDYIKIYTEVKNGVALYRAKIGIETVVLLETSTPVTLGWQHIQLAYSVGNSKALLYINGVLVFNSTETFSPPISGSIVTNYLGSNKEGTKFAQGYIDNFNLSPFYQSSKYSNLDPYKYNYKEDNTEKPNLEVLEKVNEPVISKATYTLESLDRDFKEVKIFNVLYNVKDHGFLINNLNPGRYKFTSNKIINGYNFKDEYFFIRNDKPCFLLQDVTPFIIPGSSSNINFKLKYDTSNLLKTLNVDEPRKSGVGINIKGLKSTGEEFNYTIYLYQNDNNNWILKNQYGEEEPFQGIDKNTLNISLNNIESVTKIDWDIRSFYLDNQELDFDNLIEGFSGIIEPINIMYSVDKLKDGTEYKLNLKLTDNFGNYVTDILQDIDVNYELIDLEKRIKLKNGSFDLIKNNGNHEIYYDKFVPDYGEYELYLSIYYKGEAIKSISIPINYKDTELTTSIDNTKNIYIKDLSLVNIKADAEKSIATINFKYSYNAIYEDIKYIVKCYTNGSEFSSISESILVKTDKEKILNIEVPIGASQIEVTIKGERIVKKKTIEVNNSRYKPEIFVTTTIPNIMPYNNFTLNWYGTYNGLENSDILYSYNVDNVGWTPSDKRHNLDLYNLSQGQHNVKIKAIYKNTESSIISNSFHVDAIKPVINFNNINIEPVVNSFGITEAVNIYGLANSLIDEYLGEFYINNTLVSFEHDGSFNLINIPLINDGENLISFKLIDLAGNKISETIKHNRTILNVISPENNTLIKYSPLTIVGNIPSGMDVQVYLKDPLVENTQNYNSWKKAKHNADGTFFIEDVYIHPGTNLRESATTLDMVMVTPEGNKYYKTLNYRAKELRIPIDINLSSTAVEGKNTETEIDINCSSYLTNITSWSVDFDGDGIYDIIESVDGNNSHSWKHIYSTVGMLKPRVRVITANGLYFSSTKELIIHNTILDSSNKIVENPISISTIKRNNQDHIIYTLYGEPDNSKIDVNILEKNDNSISFTEETVNLVNYLITNPIKIEALTEKRVFIASNKNGFGYINLLIKDEYGNFIEYLDGRIEIPNKIVDISTDGKFLYVTTDQTSQIYKYPIEMDVVIPNRVEIEDIVIQGNTVGNQLSLSKDHANLYVADYYNQKVLVFNDSLKFNTFFGEFGTGEGEFLKPSIIKSFGNRLFVYDEGRKDIQVFDKSTYKLLTKLSYNTETAYFEPDFLIDVADIDIITKEEGNKLYYYGVILSKSTNKLALIRLPKWEEFRAKIRNNKMAFIKDNELYTSKPSGSDLKKILSSDALPDVRGSIDYPSLSSDGQKIVFTSSKELYSGNFTTTNSYNNLYVIDIEDTNSLKRIPLGVEDTFEIERPVFNTNGDIIIFSGREKDKNWAIYTYNFNTGGVEKLIYANNVNIRYPYYSPDDRYIVFTTDIDGDEEVEIMDTLNPAVRVSVSNNNAREYYPVWSELYPYEISNKDLNIKSKIAFVTEKNYNKSIKYVYIAQKDGEFPRVVKIDGTNVGDNPDSAWNSIVTDNISSNYPSYSGDGSKIIFEGSENSSNILREIDLTNDNLLTDLSLLENARRPSGMKNKITELSFNVKNGNDLFLKWKAYTSASVSYFVEYEYFTEESHSNIRKVMDQDNTLIEDLIMGQEYNFRVYIKENGEEIASSSWKNFKMPTVSAVPTVTVDPANPYLLKLHAWKPNADTLWKFTWLIDNKEVNAQSLQDYYYEFATSGIKTILLKAATSSNTYQNISEPVTIDIKSNIVPIIEYKVSDDTTYVELSAENSTGSNIDFAATTWQITGPGDEPKTVGGSSVIIPVSKFKNLIDVNLTLKKMSISDQQLVDTIEESIIIDLKYKDTKPVITYNANVENNKLIHFSGINSLGNIDWLNAKWQITNNGNIIYTDVGLSNFYYEFKESNSESNYVVTLTVPRQDGLGNASTTSIVSINPTPIIPEIDYEIIVSKTGENINSAKLILSAEKSRGNNIDFNQTKWTVPLASKYGENPTQIGPTAVYNLLNTTELTIIEVSITMMRVGGAAPVTITKMIELNPEVIPQVEIKVKTESEVTDTGNMLIFDILSSTGPNIDWDRTKWQFNNYEKTGAIVRVDRDMSSTNGTVKYLCSVYTTGSDKPLLKRGEIDIEGKEIIPNIEIIHKSINPLSPNLREFSVNNTPGVNIDWERTKWLIPDGNSGIIEKTGSSIYHTFPLSNSGEIYRLTVHMFYKGDSKPAIGYLSVFIRGDKLEAVITKNPNEEDEKLFDFNGNNSKGLNINPLNNIWTFNDTTESKTQKIIDHKFVSSTQDRNYTVSLTVSRNLSNGKTETSTTTDLVPIGKDYIEPIIQISNGEEINSKVFSVRDTDSSSGDIDWSRTKWTIPTGTGDVIEKIGAEVSYIFPVSQDNKSYNIMVEMFLVGHSLPFTPKEPKVLAVEGVDFGVTINGTKTTFDDDMKEKYQFTASQEKDTIYDIQWDKARWDFEFNNEVVTSFGKTVYFAFDFLSGTAKTLNYKLTLTALNNKGMVVTEVITPAAPIQVAATAITPSITIKEYVDDSVILTCEDSTARGINLDTAEWYIIKESGSNERTVNQIFHLGSDSSSSSEDDSTGNSDYSIDGITNTSGVGFQKDDDGKTGKFFKEDYIAKYGSLKPVNGKIISYDLSKTKKGVYYIVLQLTKDMGENKPKDGAYIVKRISIEFDGDSRSNAQKLSREIKKFSKFVKKLW